MFGVLCAVVAFASSVRPATSACRAAPALAAGASLEIRCGDQFDARLQWLLSLTDEELSPLLRVEEIGPADAPRYARVAGQGISLWLEASPSPAQPLSLRISGVAQRMTPPDGCQIVGVEPAADQPRSQPLPLSMPSIRPSLHVSRQSDGAWGVGRAGMLYRDLLPDRAGGAVIVSHIRIPEGGPVPDYTHFHRVAFQLIFVLRGWVDVVYEGQGPPFRLHRGDFVTQPPTLCHRVLAASDGLEVLEIGMPAGHATIADHDHPLPGAERLPPGTLFGGQSFVRHDASKACDDDATRTEAGVEWRETAVREATGGLASVRIGRCVETAGSQDAPGAEPVAHADALSLCYLLSGQAVLQVESPPAAAAAAGHGSDLGARELLLASDDCFCMPPGVRYRLVPRPGHQDGASFSESRRESRLLEVRVRRSVDEG